MDSRLRGTSSPKNHGERRKVGKVRDMEEQSRLWDERVEQKRIEALMRPARTPSAGGSRPATARQRRVELDLELRDLKLNVNALEQIRRERERTLSIRSRTKRFAFPIADGNRSAMATVDAASARDEVAPTSVQTESSLPATSSQHTDHLGGSSRHEPDDTSGEHNRSRPVSPSGRVGSADASRPARDARSGIQRDLSDSTLRSCFTDVPWRPVTPTRDGEETHSHRAGRSSQRDLKLPRQASLSPASPRNPASKEVVVAFGTRIGRSGSSPRVRCEFDAHGNVAIAYGRPASAGPSRSCSAREFHWSSHDSPRRPSGRGAMASALRHPLRGAAAQHRDDAPVPQRGAGWTRTPRS